MAWYDVLLFSYSTMDFLRSLPSTLPLLHGRVVLHKTPLFIGIAFLSECVASQPCATTV